jgi:predicted nucleotidyltransferase
MEFSEEAARCLGPRVYAIWLAGSITRGDFNENISDLDLELILKIGEKRERTTYDMVELKDLSVQYDIKARELGASRFDCFVFRVNDLKPKFHILQLALFGETLFGPPPRKIINVDSMMENIGKLAMEYIHEAAKNSRDGLEGKVPLFDVKRGAEIILETENQPAIMFNAREVPKVANFVSGRGVWTRPECFQVFSEGFPVYKDLIDEMWEYRFDRGKLREKGEEYIMDFLTKCLLLPINLEKQLTV